MAALVSWAPCEPVCVAAFKRLFTCRLTSARTDIYFSYLSTFRARKVLKAFKCTGCLLNFLIKYSDEWDRSKPFRRKTNWKILSNAVAHVTFN